jgi:glyoxylase-like metal-dependent hydrolase (beta-lactamase superfamily II)
MAFLTEPEPERGAVLPVLAGISRIVAANTGPMTYHGTNTYLIETPDGLVVLDPGPDEPAHVDAIIHATGGKVDLILLSHFHHDHVGAVPALKAATGAPVAAFHATRVEGLVPDQPINDNENISGMRAVHTPGHASDHLCFALATRNGVAVLFSADHVMSWNSSVVSPPDGNMKAYFSSLRRVLDRQDEMFLPGHGPALPEPRKLTRALLFHRMERERGILARLMRGPASTVALRDALYSQTHPRLQRAAERNVLAHLLKLDEEGKVVREGEYWRVV